MQNLQNQGKCFMKTAVDSENRLDRVFISLTGMINGFKAYGQMLLVDATCKTNHFGMPLVLFVGVHGDGSTTLFGMALLRLESEETMKWAFNCLKEGVGETAWKECRSVMTDGAALFPSVIESTISHAKHVRCIWHIEEDMKRALLNKKIDGTLWTAFAQDWHKAVHCKTESDFLLLWTELRTVYAIGAGVYLDMQFEFRHKFVRCYIDQYCTLNCYSTQRCESMNRVSCYNTSSVPAL
jgi:hypothetical protein